MDQLDELFEDVKKLYQSNDDLQMIREAKVKFGLFIVCSTIRNIIDNCFQLN